MRLAGTKSDNISPAYIRAIRGHCSRPIVIPEFFKHMIEMPHGWMNVIYHSSSQQYLDTFLLRGLIAEGIGRKEGTQAWYFPAAHPQKSKAVLDRKSWKPQIVPHVHHKWHTATIYEIDLVKTQQMRLQFHQTFSYSVAHVGDVPAECIARVVGHDQTIKSRTARNGNPTRCLTDCLTQTKKQKRLDLIRNCVISIFTTASQKRAPRRTASVSRQKIRE